MTSHSINPPITVFYTLLITAVNETKYQDGNRAITCTCQDLSDEESEPDEFPLSVNLPDSAALIARDEIFAKNWSENEAIYQAFVERGILVPTGLFVPSGRVQVPICKFIPPIN